MLSIGPDSTKDGDQDSSEDKGQSKDHSKDGRGAGGKSGMGGSAGEGNIPPAGRGRGAFSQFLRTHERQIGKHINKIDKRATSPPGRRGRRGDPVVGQFDDKEDPSTKKMFVGTAREKHLTENSEDSTSSPLDENWQESWFAHEDKRIEQLTNVGVRQERGDMPELDDDEEDDHFDPNDNFEDEVWKGYTQEEIKEFKILGARLEKEEAEQMANLRAKWEEKKRAAEKEHGTSVHLELPDILITHELSYEAPAGKANADRAVPMPRPLESIVESMELPAGLDVTPDDPEYEQVVNMWTAVSRNNTMDEAIKKRVIGQISTFIAKHRNSDAFQNALQTQDFPEVQGKRPR
eukprot:jgi/Undpi1/8527/HiC_scaffold_25.g10994.m1